MGAQPRIFSSSSSVVVMPAEGKAGEATQTLIHYRAKPISAGVELDMVDELAEVLETLPTSLQLRVVMEINHTAEMHCWMMVRGATATASRELLERFNALGLGAEMREGACCPSFNFDDELHAVVRVKEGGSVTSPGMTRELTRWLLSHGHVAFLVFDYKHLAAAGLARYDLAFVMRDLAQVTQPFADAVQEVMDGDTTTYRHQRAAGFFRNLRSWTLGRPQLDACIGNIADLFPL